MALGAASVSGLALVKGAEPAEAVGASISWVYSDPATGHTPINPGQLARTAYEAYMAGRGCCEAVWWGFVKNLLPRDASNTQWTTL